MAVTPDVVVVDHHDSYTWNLVHLVARVTGVLPAVVQHDEVDARRGARPLPRGAVARPGTPGVPADFAVGREVLLAAHAAGARRLPGHAGPGDGVRRERRARAARARRGGADQPRRRGRVRGLPQGFARGALPLARPRSALPDCLVTAPLRGARTGCVMGVRHRDAAARGRAVPPRVGPVRARRRDGRELPGHPMSDPGPASFFRERGGRAPALLLARRRRRARVVGAPLDDRLARRRRRLADL